MTSLPTHCAPSFASASLERRAASRGPTSRSARVRTADLPDALIDCGRRNLGAAVASEPIAVFEVLSLGTAHVDQGLKLRDYNGLKSVRTYVILEATQPQALVYRRIDGTGLSLENVQLLDGTEGASPFPSWASRSLCRPPTQRSSPIKRAVTGGRDSPD